MVWAKTTEIVDAFSITSGVPIDISGAGEGITISPQRIFNGYGSCVVAHGQNAGTITMGNMFPKGKLLPEAPWSVLLEDDGATLSVVLLDMTTAPNNPQAHALLNVQLLPYMDMQLVYPLVKEGYLYKHFDKLTPSQSMEDHLFREETKMNYRVRYALSQKGRLLVQAFYRKLEN